MTNMTQETIATSITLIEERLSNALQLAKQARVAILDGQQNLAIGTLLPAQSDLTDVDALLRTVLLLHRSQGDAR